MGLGPRWILTAAFNPDPFLGFDQECFSRVFTPLPLGVFIYSRPRRKNIHISGGGGVVFDHT